MNAGSGLAFALGLALVCAGAVAQDAGGTPFSPEQIKKGADLYATHCATCHGSRLTKPPWDDVLKPDDIEALWAYVVAGEGKKP